MKIQEYHCTFCRGKTDYAKYILSCPPHKGDFVHIGGVIFVVEKVTYDFDSLQENAVAVCVLVKNVM